MPVIAAVAKCKKCGFECLREGGQVEFEVRRGRDGRLQTVRVRLAQSKAE